MPPTLELSMIVKNGAPGLARCLESVAGIVDRVVLGDTGSTDDTAAIARRYGAELYTVPWEHDFARARNHVLSHARCDWILVLDADEMLDSSAQTSIPSLLAAGDVFGYDVWGWSYVRALSQRCNGQQAVPNPGRLEQAGAYPAYVRTYHTRLFRRHPEIRFDHCIHENVSDRMDARQLSRRIAAFVIHHFGYVEDSADRRAHKDSMYHSLSLRKVASAPASAQAHFEAGASELDHRRDPHAALPHLLAACASGPQAPLHWLFAGICLTRLGRDGEALEHLLQAARLNASSLLLHGALGDLHFQAGRYRDACLSYEAARALGDLSPLSFAKLGAAEVQLGETERGLAKVRASVSQSPDSAELYDILATTALLAGQPEAACEAAEHRLSMPAARGFHYGLAATIHLHANRSTRAREIIDEGAQRFPRDPDVMQAHAATHVAC